MFAEYQLQIIKDNIFFLAKNEKLIPYLSNKGKYKSITKKLIKTLFKVKIIVTKNS